MIVIEIPHRMIPRAYETDEAGLIEEAHKKADEAGLAYEAGEFPDSDFTEANWAREVLFGDLAFVQEFDTIGEALLWATEYAKADHKGCYNYQAFEVEAAVEALAELLA